MKTIYSKKELVAKAIALWEQHPEQDLIFAREDGNLFFNENYAQLGKGKLKILPLKRADYEQIKKNKVEGTTSVEASDKINSNAIEVKQAIDETKNAEKQEKTLGTPKDKNQQKKI